MKLVSQTLVKLLVIVAGFAVFVPATLASRPDTVLNSDEATPLSKQEIEALVIRDEACNHSASELGRVPIGCALGNTALGIDYSLRLEAEGQKVAVRAVAAREAEGALSLDRLMFSRNTGMVEESSFAGLMVDVELFEGRVQLESSWTWTERWLAQQEATMLFSNRQEGRGDAAQAHKMVVIPINRPGLRWSISAEYARAGDEYWAGRLSSNIPITVFAGSRLAFVSSLSVNKWRLSASLQNQRSLFAEAENRKLKVAIGGIGLNITDQNSAIAPMIQYPTLPLARTNKKAVSLDFDLHTLMPGLASLSSVPAVLLPKYSTFSLEQRTTLLAQSGSQYQRKSFDFTGMWDSRLGDTHVNYRVDQKRPLVGVSSVSDDTMLYVSQSFRRDAWRFGIDVIKTTSRSGVGGDETSDSLSIGGSVRYSRPKGPEFQLLVGRDNSAYERGSRAIMSRDTGIQVHAVLDMTKWLRAKFEREDVYLRAEYRYRMREDKFDFELFEGLYERERDSLVRHALLMHLGFKL